MLDLVASAFNLNRETETETEFGTDLEGWVLTVIITISEIRS